MFAVIESGGKQLPASRKEEILRLEKLAAGPGETVTFDRVLTDCTRRRCGRPRQLRGRRGSHGRSRGEGRGEKITVIKFKRRKNYHRKQGHRQSYTEVG